MPVAFLDLPALLPGAQLRQAPADSAAEISTLLLDSRRVGLARGALFFALRGPRHDGHRHLPELYAKGVRLFVVETLPADLAAFPEAGFVQAISSLAALQTLAAHHRQAFHGPVLAVTGSNGKTIVKEWLAQLLAPDDDVCRSPKSYNSQVGVPLSVWELTPGRHTLGLFEAGISEPGEMARLAAVIRPTAGIFTNLGTAHDAGFASRQEKLAEKLKLFEAPGLECLYYCRDHAEIHAAVAARGLAAFTWTRHGFADADVQVRDLTGLAVPSHETSRGASPPRPPSPAERGEPNDSVLASLAMPSGSPLSTGEGGRGGEASREATTFHVTYAGHTFALALPFADAPSVENALHCVAVLLHRGVPAAEIQRRLARLHPVAMRLEMKQGRHDCYLLDDAYNNDLAGLALALDALGRQARPGRRTVVLSDVLESGLRGEELYARVVDLLRAHGVTRLVGIGPEISQLTVRSEELKMGEEENSPSRSSADRADPETTAPNSKQLSAFNSQLLTEFHPTTEAFLASLRPDSFRRETILVKGARRFGFERVVAALQAQQHGTVLEVNLDALAHNLQYYRQQLRPETKLMVMVKAFAYGSGSYEVASLLQFQRADYLAVAYADEGQALRDNGIGLPILVLNPAPDSFEQLRRYRLEPEIYSLERLHDYLLAARGAPLPPLHLKLDTGMRRLGFDEADLPALLDVLARHRDALPVASLMTHLAAADEPRHDEFTCRQLAAFRRMTAAVEAVLGRPVLKHALNSAGIVRFPEAQFDMVRLGVGLYGVEASGERPDALRSVSTLRTTVSQVKTLPAGESVGYGRRGAPTTHPRRLATLAIGYADGYDRRFSQGAGAVLLHGRRAPVVGSVCMDMVMVDVTDIPETRAGDVAVVFGDELSLTELAARIGTIPYELLTNVSERVKRVFVSE